MILFFAFSWAVRELPPQLPTGWRRKKRPTASDKESRKMTVWNPSRVVIPSQKAVKIPFRRFACKVAEIKVAFLNVSVDLFMTRKPCPNRKRMITRLSSRSSLFDSPTPRERKYSPPTAFDIVLLAPARDAALPASLRVLKRSTHVRATVRALAGLPLDPRSSRKF